MTQRRLVLGMLGFLILYAIHSWNFRLSLSPYYFVKSLTLSIVVVGAWLGLLWGVSRDSLDRWKWGYFVLGAALGGIWLILGARDPVGIPSPFVYGAISGGFAATSSSYRGAAGRGVGIFTVQLSIDFSLWITVFSYGPYHPHL